MRLTLSQQVQSTLLQLNAASTKLSDTQSRAATGKRILRPSDDVTGTDRALTLRSAISNLEQMSDNTLVTKPLLGVTENALGDITTLLTSARNTAMAAASGTLMPDEREAYATQIDNMLGEIVDKANTRYMGRYVFSGTATNDPAVVTGAGPAPYDYNGDDGIRKTQILPGISTPVNITGREAFSFDAPPASENTDLFTALEQLSEAVRHGTVNDISDELRNIDVNQDRLLMCRARVGAWIQKLDRADSTLSDTKLRMQELLSNVEDVDLAQAVIELQTQQNIYQAALQVSSNVLQLSLASLKYQQ